LAHVPFFSTNRQAFRIAVDDEASERFARRRLWVGIGARQHKVPVGHAAVGDPHFLSIDHPFVALLLSTCFHTSHIAAGARLRHAVGLSTLWARAREQTHGGQRLDGHSAKILFLLLVIGGEDDGRLG
jgi:hypothetical protein